VPTRPSTGRARNEQARRDVLRAALDLAGEGVEAMTVDALAARAGVGKQTIYRWWPSKWLVVLEALLEHAEHEVVAAADGPLEERVTKFLTSSFALITGPGHTGPILKALMAHAQLDPDFADAWRIRFIQPRRQALLHLLEPLGATPQGDATPQGEGSAAPGPQAEAAVDLLFGAMWYRLLIGHAPLDESYARSLSAAALALGLAGEPGTSLRAASLPGRGGRT
jgi:AcrR family transcriptional regulator